MEIALFPHRELVISWDTKNFFIILSNSISFTQSMLENSVHLFNFNIIKF